MDGQGLCENNQTVHSYSQFDMGYIYVFNLIKS